MGVGLYLMRTDFSFRWYPHGISYKLHIAPLYMLTYPLNYYDGVLGDICLGLYLAGICWLLLSSEVNQKSLLMAATLFSPSAVHAAR